MYFLIYLKKNSNTYKALPDPSHKLHTAKKHFSSLYQRYYFILQCGKGLNYIISRCKVVVRDDV